MSEAAIPRTAIRERLPNRREHELIDFEHEGRRYTAGIGRFDDGSLAEIFMNVSGRAGGMVEVLARDTAVAASLCLQFGCDVETLRRALMRDSQGRASGPVGRFLDLAEQFAANREPGR
jgi:DNA-binding IclR family transcriptional regulator